MKGIGMQKFNMPWQDPFGNYVVQYVLGLQDPQAQSKSWHFWDSWISSLKKVSTTKAGKVGKLVAPFLPR